RPRQPDRPEAPPGGGLRQGKIGEVSLTRAADPYYHPLLKLLTKGRVTGYESLPRAARAGEGFHFPPAWRTAAAEGSRQSCDSPRLPRRTRFSRCAAARPKAAWRPASVSRLRRCTRREWHAGPYAPRWGRDRDRRRHPRQGPADEGRPGAA